VPSVDSEGDLAGLNSPGDGDETGIWTLDRGGDVLVLAVRH